MGRASLQRSQKGEVNSLPRKCRKSLVPRESQVLSPTSDIAVIAQLSLDVFII
jgi:hypothetical protein